MYFLVYLCGVLSAGLFSFLGVYLYRFFFPTELRLGVPQSFSAPSLLKKSGQKRSPKALSDADLWKKEQNEL